MINRCVTILFCLFIITGMKPDKAYSQNGHSVSGVVTDSDSGESLPGVNILLKGTTRGTTTDLEGSYQISNISPSDTLVFNYIGYGNVEVPINGRSAIDVQLSPETIVGDELVVVGYGQQRRRDLTGSIASVNVEDIGDVNVTNFGEAIQGMVPGVTVRTTGQPGSEPSMQIRGMGNFTNNEPLYIIDGVPTRANRDFNVNDIESIQILKDASAAAIYGSRAANGVVIITTKSGREGPMRIDFNSSTSRDWLPRFDLMDRETWIEFNNRAYDEAGVPRQNHFEANTDWQDETFQTALRTDNNLTISGGSESGTYLLSLNHQSNEGTTIGSTSERIGIRLNTESTRGILTVGENLAITNFDVQELNTNPIADVTRMLPTIPVYDSNNPGGFGYGNENRARTFGVNPVAREALEDAATVNQRIRGNAYLELDWSFLNYRFNYGLDYNSHNYDFLRREGNWTLNHPFEPSRIYSEKGGYNSHLFENTLTLIQEFSNHKVTALAGQSYQTFSEERIWGEAQNVIEAGGEYFNLLDAATTDARTGGWLQEGAILSFFGRLNYNYNDRYIAEFTMRYDGTSRLPEDNRWKAFPSVSGAWRISQEDFFDVDWIDDLKLNASYGLLGSSNIGFYDYQSVLNINPQYVFGENVHSGVTQVELVNQNLRWETLTQTNIGVEAVLFDARLLPKISYFNSETQDVLTEMPILMTTGNDGGNPFVNAASLKNTGFEIDLTWTDEIRDKNLNYSIGVNFGKTQNEIVELGYGQTVFYTGQTINEIGHPIGTYYLIKTDGLFRSESEVLAHTNSEGNVIQPNARPGDIRYADVNDDGQITSADRTIVGSPWPSFEYGINLSARWKSWDFRVQGFGAYDFDIFNGPRSVMDRFDDNSGYRSGIEPWTPENPDTDFPRIIYADQRNSRGDIDRWLEDGSFFKIREITIGYTLPPTILSDVFQRLRVSVTGQNLVTFTNYTGLDPEFVAPSIFDRTHDNYRYPTPRTVSFNLQLSI